MDENNLVHPSYVVTSRFLPERVIFDNDHPIQDFNGKKFATFNKVSVFSRLIFLKT
jgi:hypothetical protein